MLEYLRDAIVAMMVSHQSGVNMLDTHAARLYAEGWLAEKVNR